MIRDGRWVWLATALATAGVLVLLRPVAIPVTAERISVEPQPNGHTRYEITFDRQHEVDAIDFAGAMTADTHGVTLKSFTVTADGAPLMLFSGYRPIQLRNGLRIGFNRHVEATSVAVILDNTITSQPTQPSEVRAFRFALRLAPQ